MNIKKETTTKTNSKIIIFTSNYYFNFQNFLFYFKAIVFLMIAGIFRFRYPLKVMRIQQIKIYMNKFLNLMINGNGRYV